MSIKRSPKLPTEDAQEQFIQAAPDAGTTAEHQPHKAVGVMKGSKRQITLTIDPELLDRVDNKAGDLKMKRAAWVNLAILNALDNGLVIGK